MTAQPTVPEWRATGPYKPNNSSKAGLLEEIRLFLRSYAETHDLEQTKRLLLQEKLPQRSRSTRVTILRVIQERLTRWNPPVWALEDLAQFALETYQPNLEAALLLHGVRQDRLLYDFVAHELGARWVRGDHTLIRSDVQRFLDQSQAEHPEIERWNHSTREKLARNMLSILRDYGLLRGRERKTLIEPNIPPQAAAHLVRLLHAEGVSDEAIADHPDWRIWLWEPARVRETLSRLREMQEHAA